jgi:hypothetical protein
VSHPSIVQADSTVLRYFSCCITNSIISSLSGTLTPHCLLLTDHCVLIAADANACVSHPCANGAGVAVCRDLPPPALDAATGRTCTCNAGFSYKDDTRGCVGAQQQLFAAHHRRQHSPVACAVAAANVNACLRHPCRNGAGTAVCRDLPPPAPDAASGRTCTCGPGYAYQSEATGCTGEQRCMQHQQLVPKCNVACLTSAAADSFNDDKSPLQM